MRVQALTTIACGLLLCVSSHAWAADAAKRPAEARRIEKLERDNRELQERLDAVERRLATPLPVPTSAPGEASSSSNIPGLGLGIRNGAIRASFQFFGNSDFRYEDMPLHGGASTAFAAGALDFFSTVEVAERFQMLAEMVGEGDSATNEFDFELERLWGSWTFNDALYVKLGREHSPVTHWNRLYHHGRWLWPSATSPFMARFEDEGGPLPIHQVGLEIGGRVEVALGSLDYIAALSNGRDRSATTVANVSDPNSSKAYDFSISVAPYALRALVVGANFYADEIPRDDQDAARQRAIREFIGSGWLSWSGSGFEVLGEAAAVEHKDRFSQRTFHHAMGYAHVGYKVGELTPYLRFDVREMERDDPFYAPAGIDRDAWEQVAGLRYDLTDNVVLKIEGGLGDAERRHANGHRTVSRCAAQLAWVF